jgi:hypothetical protein
VIDRLIIGWLDLLIGAVAGTGDVLVGTVDRGVRRHLPGNQPSAVSESLQQRPQPRLDPLPLPAPEQLVYRLPG